MARIKQTTGSNPMVISVIYNVWKERKPAGENCIFTLVALSLF